MVVLFFQLSVIVVTTGQMHVMSLDACFQKQIKGYAILELSMFTYTLKSTTYIYLRPYI